MTAEERMMWVERYSALPTGNVADAMDGLGLIETVGVDVPVTLCGVLIFPGDMVVMDRTGVVVVPSGKIAEVYESASRIAKREERVVVHLREGKTLKESRKLAAAEAGQ